MAILKLLTIVTLVCFPLGEFGRYIFPQLGNAPLLLNDFLVGITVLLWLGNKVKKKRLDSVLSLPVGLFILICIVSLLVNSTLLTLPQMGLASLYILRWGVYAGLYFVVKDFDTAFKQKMLVGLVSVGQITVGIGYLQFFLYPSLRNLYYLGWDEHLYRMFSVFLDPNFAGVVFTLIFMSTVGLAMQKLAQKKLIDASILFVFSFFDVLAVYLTYSRSALLMLLVSVFVFLWLYGKGKYILIAVVFFLAIIVLSPKSFQTEGTNIFRIASSEARLASAQNAFAIFSKHPLFGVGFNAYRYAQNKYGYISGKYWVVSHAGAGTDNSFLFVLATTGISGFCVYLFLWYRILLLEKKALSIKGKKIEAIITIASLGGVFISALFINSLFYVFIMQWLWILIGISASED